MVGLFVILGEICIYICLFNAIHITFKKPLGSILGPFPDFKSIANQKHSAANPHPAKHIQLSLKMLRLSPPCLLAGSSGGPR